MLDYYVLMHQSFYNLQLYNNLLHNCHDPTDDSGWFLYPGKQRCTQLYTDDLQHYDAVDIQQRVFLHPG
jgi:hypothetical protein